MQSRVEKKEKLSLKELPGLSKETFKEWYEDNPFDLSAIVSYYSIFALPGLLMIVITIAGSVFGEEAVGGELEKVIGEILGKSAGAGIQTMIADAHKKGSSSISTVFGVIILLFSATGVFSAFQRSLNKVWDVKPDPEKYGFKRILINRTVSFGMLLVIGFLLLTSLLMTSILSFLSGWISQKFPESLMYLFYALKFLLSFSIVTTMFALIYKYLPDVEIKWKSVWIGAVVTAILFLGGEFLLSLYFRNVNPGSPYGVAGFFILILLWVSYSCLIVFLGAEFTKVYTKRYIREIEPTKYAVKTK